MMRECAAWSTRYRLGKTRKHGGRSTNLDRQEIMLARFGVLARGEKFNSAFSFPQRCEMGAGRVNRFTPRGLPILSFFVPTTPPVACKRLRPTPCPARQPISRTMRVVLTAKQVWGRKAE